jgi:transcriptional regulator with XRE-family HTH domain
MQDELFKKIVDETPMHSKDFVRFYGKFLLRVQEILKEKSMTQAELATKLGKSQSEVSKWLNGTHNLTLQSIFKIQRELGEYIIGIPPRRPLKGKYCPLQESRTAGVILVTEKMEGIHEVRGAWNCNMVFGTRHKSKASPNIGKIELKNSTFNLEYGKA